MSLLYDENFIAALFLALVGATPVVALVGFLIHNRAASGGCARTARVLWVVFGLAGPLNYGLWHLYNVIEDNWGLDRVEPLLVNFVIFVALGIVIGLLLRFFLGRDKPKPKPAPPEPEREEPSP